MKWKTFFQIILLIIFAAVVFYMVFPKYHFLRAAYRANKITGKVEEYRNHKWIDVTKYDYSGISKKKTNPILEEYGIK